MGREHLFPQNTDTPYRSKYFTLIEYYARKPVSRFTGWCEMPGLQQLNFNAPPEPVRTGTVKDLLPSRTLHNFWRNILMYSVAQEFQELEQTGLARPIGSHNYL